MSLSWYPESQRCEEVLGPRGVQPREEVSDDRQGALEDLRHLGRIERARVLGDEPRFPRDEALDSVVVDGELPHREAALGREAGGAERGVMLEQPGVVAGDDGGAAAG